MAARLRVATNDELDAMAVSFHAFQQRQLATTLRGYRKQALILLGMAVLSGTLGKQGLLGVLISVDFVLALVALALVLLVTVVLLLEMRRSTVATCRAQLVYHRDHGDGQFLA